MSNGTQEKGKLLGRVRRQRLKYVALLPSLITLINGLCGFAAIGFASKALMQDQPLESLRFFGLSGYMIFIAMIADMLDGRVARMSQSTSSFGGQLDSLCDMISFGVAPAFLMLKVLQYKLGFSEINPGVLAFLERFVWLAGGVYVACTAIRLARFNVENEEAEAAHMSFLGLPSPAAAGVVASIILFYNMLPDVTETQSNVFWWTETSIMVVLPFLTLGAAILMISRIRYPHVVNQYMKGREPFAYLIWSLVLIGLLVWNHQLTVMISFLSFAFSGVARKIYFKFIVKSDPLDAEIDEHAMDTTV